MNTLSISQLQRCFQQFLTLSGDEPLESGLFRTLEDAIEVLGKHCELKEVLIAQGSGEFLKSNLENTKNFPFLLLAHISDQVTLPAVVRHDFLNDAFEAWLFHPDPTRDEYFSGKMAESLLDKPLVTWKSLKNTHQGETFALVPQEIKKPRTGYTAAKPAVKMEEPVPSYVPPQKIDENRTEVQESASSLHSQLKKQEAASKSMELHLTSTVNGLHVLFSSDIPAGEEVKEYIWRFGDGSSQKGTSPEIAHTYEAAGEFTATLNVVTTTGRQAKTSHAFTLAAPIKKGMDGKQFMKPIAASILLLALIFAGWKFFGNLSGISIAGPKCQQIPEYLQGTVGRDKLKVKIDLKTKSGGKKEMRYQYAQMGKGPDWEKLACTVNLDEMTIHFERLGQGKLAIDPRTCQWSIAGSTKSGQLEMVGMQTQ